MLIACRVLCTSLLCSASTALLLNSSVSLLLSVCVVFVGVGLSVPKVRTSKAV